jgi:hypothetical protein
VGSCGWLWVVVGGCGWRIVASETISLWFEEAAGLGRDLTDGGEDRGGEVEGTGEFPLHSGFVRHALDDDRGQNAKIVIRNVVLAHQNSFDLFKCGFLSDFVFTFESIENGSSDQQIREGADDQRKSANVLSLHGDQIMKGRDRWLRCKRRLDGRRLLALDHLLAERGDCDSSAQVDGTGEGRIEVGRSLLW